MNAADQVRSDAPPGAERIFGARLPDAQRFVELLRVHGVERGLIGPRELDRLWDRHVLNSAVLAECVPNGARVVDVGSGGGFPGVPLALARRDIQLTLLEPMARRVEWLREVVDVLQLSHVDVVRGRAEARAIRDALGVADVVTARAVAPLAKLGAWCLPLVRSGGVLLALKGASVHEELARDSDALRAAGGGELSIVECGVGIVNEPTTVLRVVKAARRGATRRSSRKRP